jgi:hypothetical protein
MYACWRAIACACTRLMTSTSGRRTSSPITGADTPAISTAASIVPWASAARPARPTTAAASHRIDPCRVEQHPRERLRAASFGADRDAPPCKIAELVRRLRCIAREDPHRFEVERAERHDGRRGIS